MSAVKTCRVKFLSSYTQAELSCVLLEVLRHLKMQPESIQRAVWGHTDWGSACMCAASWGFHLDRKMLFFWSVLIPYHVGIRSEGSVWGCMKDNGQGPGARMMSPFNVCSNQHNWSVILSQPVKSFLLPRIHKLTALNFIMSEKHKARLFCSLIILFTYQYEQMR